MNQFMSSSRYDTIRSTSMNEADPLMRKVGWRKIWISKFGETRVRGPGLRFDSYMMLAILTALIIGLEIDH